MVAYVTREGAHGRELLVFEHRDDPRAGTQVPAGRLDRGESVEDCLLRELHEEAGLDHVRIVRELGTYEPGELPHGKRYRNHAFEVEAPGAPDAWEHEVFGDGDDAGLVFVYRWEPLAADLPLWRDGDPVLAELLK